MDKAHLFSLSLSLSYISTKMSEHQTSIKLHMIDISEPILQQSSLASLAEACKTWGFFHITNHGISSELYTKICSMSRDLFSLPLETKLKLGPSSPTKTYTPQFIASPFFESLRVPGPNFFASAQSSSDIILFDQHNSTFRYNLVLLHSTIESKPSFTWKFFNANA